MRSSVPLHNVERHMVERTSCSGICDRMQTRKVEVNVVRAIHDSTKVIDNLLSLFFNFVLHFLNKSFFYTVLGVSLEGKWRMLGSLDIFSKIVSRYSRYNVAFTMLSTKQGGGPKRGTGNRET